MWQYGLMSERSIDARLLFLVFPALSLVIAGAAVHGYGVQLDWNVLSFVPVAVAVVVLIAAQLILRRFLSISQVQSMSDGYHFFVISWGTRIAPGLAAAVGSVLVARFSHVVSAVLVGQACALILYVRAWPGARTCGILRMQVQAAGTSELFDEWLSQHGGRPRVPWSRR
jgi:hypothetical protein